MIKIAICDDEIKYISTLKKILTEYSLENDIKVEIFTYNNGKEILEANVKYDIIFLDIEMENMDGIEVAKRVRRQDMKVPIVYVTSYQDYWRRAYEVHAFQFIVKPIKKIEIYSVMRDFLLAISDKNEKKVMFVTDGGMITVNQNDIYYFDIKQKKNVLMKTVDGSYIVKENLRDIYEKLDKDQFYMAHKSCIVNLRFINRLENLYDIIMENGDFLPLAQSKRAEFLRRLFPQYIKRQKGEIL